MNGDDQISAADIEDTIASAELHSTSDALNLLSHAATYARPGQRPHGMAESSGSVVSPVNSIPVNLPSHDQAGQPSYGSLQYPLVLNGLLSTIQVAQLVDR